MGKIQTERPVIKNGVLIDLSTLRMPWSERDAGIVEGEKLRMRHDRWTEIRTAVVQRAAELILDGAVSRTTPLWDVVLLAADQRLDNPLIFTQMNVDAMRRVQYAVTALVRKGVNEVAGRRSNITVTTTEGEVLGVPKPGMDEVNMNDGNNEASTIDDVESITINILGEEEGDGTEVSDEEAAALIAKERGRSAFEGRDDLEEQAAKAGVEVKRKAPKAMPLCLCGCGERTGGGRFRPGHDAKLKSRLVEEFRSENDEVSRKAHTQLVQLGWEKYATAAPTKGRPVPDDGLGTGPYLIKNEEGDLIQRVASDEDALTWMENNDYNLVRSFENGVIAALDGFEDDDESDDDDDDNE